MEGEGADLSCLVSHKSTQGNGSYLHQEKFRLDIKNNFFTERMGQSLEQAPQGAPSLPEFEEHQKDALSHMLNFE